MRAVTMLNASRSPRAVRLPNRCMAVGVTKAMTESVAQTSAAPNQACSDSSSAANRWSNGTVNRNASRTWTPVTTTRSSCRSP